MRDLEKKYRKFRRPEKPERCPHCQGKRMVPRGDIWGCFDCGHWEGEDDVSASRPRNVFDSWKAGPR